MSKYRDTCCSALMVHDQLTALKEDLEEMDSILPIFRKHHDNAPDSPNSRSKCLDWSKLKLFVQSTVRPTSKPSNHQLDWSN